ncbi:helix-turn-helix domain-containing protein [Pseudaminobacter soli (ex Li et al. 2025)]|uniref:HTH cro/C1-type domain-containing protein n=1 Tax=Pseudaminobacter soli (ex Li et al. 2025) TaxID=1295366 RepID=A0A2P7S2H8_9HYPH|nr:helix-turn-helix transcriptional regulator [Mesorhizobium soli]PSJ56671.1 hypothetical protein C7I85_24265 [Mesorhizobium soli]
MDGNALMSLRKKFGLTQNAMAAKMGLSRRAYFNSEVSGEEKINARHQLLAERVALSEAVSQGDPSLATPNVRQEAEALAKMLDDPKRT